MPRRNGPIRVGDLTPELIPAIELLRDGTPVVLRGYVLGARCPGTIKARVAATSQAYTLATAVTVDNGNGAIVEEFRHDERAWREYHRDLLLDVIVGLEEAEADTLSGDTSRAQVPLRYLGWLPSLDDDETEADTAEDDDDDPEADAVSSTTASSSQSSPPATDSPRASF